MVDFENLLGFGNDIPALGKVIQEAIWTTRYVISRNRFIYDYVQHEIPGGVIAESVFIACRPSIFLGLVLVVILVRNGLE